MLQALREENIDKATLITIVVAALGYFVDIFDLLLFSIVRVESLRDLGLDASLASKVVPATRKLADATSAAWAARFEAEAATL